MLFNSVLFLLFFIVVTILYYLLPHKYRWAWLLLGSCYFYMCFKPAYILIIFFTIIIDYCAGLLIEKAKGQKRKLFLIISLLANIGVLAFYKYFNFLAGNVNVLMTGLQLPQIPLVSFVLPIGLSFHTFQAMSYTIEVYRGNQRAERHLGIYSLYVLFYPQMVAGPIERPQHILHQFYSKINFNSQNLVGALFLMAIGFFKKVVIADRLGLYVDPIFSDSHHHTAAELLIGTYFFALQIYCDFSGYTDIAIGAALALGINLMQNFNMPYLSRNISEFWKRWHISLSTWFRDYVYIPLGGNRRGFYFTCVNLMVVFLLSGLWHGANWKYVIWGAIHGTFLIGYQILNKYKITLKTHRLINWIITFNLVCLAWIFFRANSVNDAFYILVKIFTGSFKYTATSIMAAPELFYCATLILFLLIGEWYIKKKHNFTIPQKITIASALVIACYFLGIFNEAQFIYFQF